jgi:hypothetical protein
VITPEDLERDFTLLSAAARYDELRTREALASVAYDQDEADGPDKADGSDEADGSDGPNAAADPLGRADALELLALGEVIARKAGYGRQLTVRSARQAGASWSQIGAALGTSKQAAWEAHSRWIDGQAEQRRRSGYEGLGPDGVAAARALAGPPE